MAAKRAYVLAAEEDQNDACQEAMNALFEFLATELGSFANRFPGANGSACASSRWDTVGALESCVYRIIGIVADPAEIDPTPVDRNRQGRAQ
jgi:hypothetical protein